VLETSWLAVLYQPDSGLRVDVNAKLPSPGPSLSPAWLPSAVGPGAARRGAAAGASPRAQARLGQARRGKSRDSAAEHVAQSLFLPPAHRDGGRRVLRCTRAAAAHLFAHQRKGLGVVSRPRVAACNIRGRVLDSPVALETAVHSGFIASTQLIRACTPLRRTILSVGS
jgi:hypothetical protein